MSYTGGALFAGVFTSRTIITKPPPLIHSSFLYNDNTRHFVIDGFPTV